MNRFGQIATRRRAVGSLAAGGLAGVIGLLAACDQPPLGPPGNNKGCTQPMEIYVPWGETTEVRAGLDKTVADFQAAHPQCALQVTTVSPWTADKLAAGLAAGAAPLLTMLLPAAVTTWGPQGLLEPVYDLFKQAKLTGTDFFPPVWETMSWQGKVWHLPVQVDANFPFFWNKAALRDVGLDPDKPPATVDELDQAAQRLNREDGGQLERVASVPWDWYGLGNSLTTAAYMFGGSFYDKTRDKATFNHPQVVKAVEWLAGWAQRLGRERVTQLHAGTNREAMVAAGRVAFQPLVSIDVLPIKRQNPGVELGYGPLPGSAPGQPGAVWTGGWHVAAVRGTKRREEAWALMRWIGASDEGTLSVAKQMGGLSGYVKSPGLDLLATDVDMVAHVDAIKRAKFLPPGFYVPASVNLSPLEEVVDGRRTARSALDEINDEAQRKLDELRTQRRK